MTPKFYSEIIWPLDMFRKCLSETRIEMLLQTDWGFIVFNRATDVNDMNFLLWILSGTGFNASQCQYNAQ